ITLSVHVAGVFVTWRKLIRVALASSEGRAGERGIDFGGSKGRWCTAECTWGGGRMIECRKPVNRERAFWVVMRVISRPRRYNVTRGSGVNRCKGWQLQLVGCREEAPFGDLESS